MTQSKATITFSDPLPLTGTAPVPAPAPAAGFSFIICTFSCALRLLDCVNLFVHPSNH